jgi:hypothetical protein
MASLQFMTTFLSLPVPVPVPVPMPLPVPVPPLLPPLLLLECPVLSPQLALRAQHWPGRQ